MLVRDPDGRFAPPALRRTDLTADPAQLLAWFVVRWRMGGTQEEVRRHLGVAPQRQWAEMASRRTTPALFGLVS